MGLLTPQITEAVRKRRERPTLYRTVLREFDDLRYRLVRVVYQVQASRGLLSKEILTWVSPIVAQYQGAYRNDRLISSLEQLATASETELNQSDGQQVLEGRHERLRAYEAPFLERLMPELGLFEPDLQRSLLDIRAQLGFFNELSKDQREMLQLSFDSGLSAGDRKRVEANLQSTYDDAVDRAMSIVERINGLEKKHIAKRWWPFRPAARS